MPYVIDRFEGKYAVLENQQTLAMEQIPIASLPQACREGDLVAFQDNRWIHLPVDERTKRIAEKMNRLFR